MASVLQEADTTVAFTGAGISKSAGIPTFRDLDDGLWRDGANLQWAHRQTYDADPEQWYVKFWEFYDRRLAAAPTAAHYALKDMVEASVIDTIVTQNIDGLDMLAGTDASKVIEVHGNDRQLSCTDVDHCGFFIGTDDWLLGGDRERLPTCLRDGKPLKPDVMLFDDEIIPQDLISNFLKSEATIDAADALIVVGTTLEIPAWHSIVYKFAVLDRKPVIVVNPHTSHTDEYAQSIIHETADEALPALRNLTV